MHPLICRDWKSGNECWNPDCKRLHPKELTVDIRPKKAGMGPRMAQNFQNVPIAPTKAGQGNAQWSTMPPVSGGTYKTQLQNENAQAVFLDFKKEIMDGVASMVAQMIAQNQ